MNSVLNTHPTEVHQELQNDTRTDISPTKESAADNAIGQKQLPVSMVITHAHPETTDDTVTRKATAGEKFRRSVGNNVLMTSLNIPAGKQDGVGRSLQPISTTDIESFGPSRGDLKLNFMTATKVAGRRDKRESLSSAGRLDRRQRRSARSLSELSAAYRGLQNLQSSKSDTAGSGLDSEPRRRIARLADLVEFMSVHPKSLSAFKLVSLTPSQDTPWRDGREYGTINDRKYNEDRNERFNELKDVAMMNEMLRSQDRGSLGDRSPLRLKVQPIRASQYQQMLLEQEAGKGNGSWLNGGDQLGKLQGVETAMKRACPAGNASCRPRRIVTSQSGVDPMLLMVGIGK